jgi:hypothetical protein
MSDAKKPPAEEENLYRPPGPGPNVFDGFSTLNTQGSRPGIDDHECWWLDGFMPIGRSYIRTLWGVGPPLFVSGHLIPPGPPAPPPQVMREDIYITGQSCELFRWPLTATGTNPTPDVDITGMTSTLTGPLGNLNSNTLAVDVDPSGNQYVLQQNKQVSDNKWVFSIPVFAPNATGNPAPIHNIVGTNTNFPRQFIEANFGGICLDASQNIYAGLAGTLVGGGNNGAIIKFAAGADGNAVGTIIVTEADFQVQALAYDGTNNLIWAGGNLASDNTAEARSYTTAGVLHSTIICSTMATVGEVFIGPTGQIILAGILGSDGTKTLVKVYPSGSSGTDPATTQSIQISAPQGPIVSCAAMDSAGLLYIGPVFVGLVETINVYAAGATGINPATLRTFNSTLFSSMGDGTATNITNIVVRKTGGGMSIIQGISNILDPFVGSTTQPGAHGLPSGPTILSIYFQCKIAEHGYNIGDIAFPGEDIANLGGGSIWTVSADATNTYIATNNFGGGVGMTDRVTGANFSITPANWKLVVVPYLVA